MKVKQLDQATFQNDYTKLQPLSADTWPYLPWITMVGYSDGPRAVYPETHFGDIDKQFASLYNRVIGEVEVTKRKQIADDMQQIQWERGGYVIWGFQTLVSAASTRVTGYISDDPTGWAFSSFAFRHVSFS